MALKTAFLNPAGRRVFQHRFLREVARGRRPKLASLVNSAVRGAYRAYGSAGPMLSNHSTAAVVRLFAPVAWESYTKFCFVRNPYDREVSEYSWCNRQGHPVTFEEFLRRKLDPKRPDPEGLVPSQPTNWEIYTIDDEVVVDFIGRYENFEPDLARLGERLGLDLDLRLLPHAKSGIRRRRDYLSFYSSTTIDLVQELHHKELNHFGYGL